MAVLIVLLQAISLCVSPQRERDEGSQYGKTTMLRAHAGYLERDYVLKLIVNGVGNYYIEAQTRDERRTDVIVDYLGEQFVVELKIWRGSKYNERGEVQLADYLEYYHPRKGYMFSFNFSKTKKRD